MADDTATTDDALKQQIVEALKTIFDPEIPVSLYELGLIYDIRIDPDRNVNIDMTLTTPACPVAGILPLQVETKVKCLEGVNACKVDIVWDPPWTQDRMSEAAKLQLGLDLAAPEPPKKNNYFDLRTPPKRSQS